MDGLQGQHFDRRNLGATQLLKRPAAQNLSVSGKDCIFIQSLRPVTCVKHVRPWIKREDILLF